MPSPSAACQACKRRRIKCDETKPTCKNCRRSQRICLDANAVKQANFSIHVENDFASGKSKRPRGPRSTLSTPHLQDDLKTRALTYYLNTHIQSPVDGSHFPVCLSGSISAWKLSGRSSPMVDLALTAVALVVYSRTQQQPAAGELGAQIYYQLLRTLQDRIGDLSSIDDFDAWLLTTKLMGRYEGATHGPGDFDSEQPFNQVRNWAHQDGAQAVLRLWYDRSMPGPATYIVNQTRRGLMRTSLLRNIPLPEWMLDGSHFGEKDLDLQYDRIEVRLASLRHATRRLEEDNDIDSAKIDELDAQAQQLDQELQNWTARIPKKCSYERHMVLGEGLWPRTHFYSPTVYTFSKPGYATVWLQFFSTKMLIISTRLRILTLSHTGSLEDPYKKQTRDCHAVLETAANDLASIVPFVLGKVKIEYSATAPKQPKVLVNEGADINPCQAIMVIWPLSISAGLRGVHKQQQPWFRSELAGLGKLLGDGIIESAESKNWIAF
ncbi:hypothetical protein N431DRAFT_389228 [Stipitochalara longipes BDJ]|nr:hypothetical protein N431DRAFT_389228 [Stipitochalara longipes BDJ]